jgi:hypothetical protein
MTYDDKLRAALETLGKAAQEAGEAIAKSLSATQADYAPSGPSETFSYTDSDGDAVVVNGPRRGCTWVLRIETPADPVVYLDHDAVNRLAQYIDQYRTDGRFNEACEALPEPVSCPWRYRRLNRTVDACDRGDHEGFTHGRGEIKWYESADRAFKAIPDETLGSVVLDNCVPRMSKCGVCGHGSHGTNRCTAEMADERNARTCSCRGRAEDYRADPSTRVDFNAFYCPGSRIQSENPKAGCDHPRDQHGASGCSAIVSDSGSYATVCECERRNGE